MLLLGVFVILYFQR